MKKAQNKSGHFIVSLIVYPFDILVSWGENDAAVEKELKKYGVKDSKGWKYQGENNSARFCSFKGNQGIIRLRKRPSTPADFGILQHEIFHAVATTMWKVGMKLSIQKSDEAYAYLTGYLTKEIYEKL